MKRFLKLRRGQKGFTLIELLIVVAILGILAAVLVPNLATFIGTGTVAAANTEAANVETAALAFYADNNATWPTNSADLMATIKYLSAPPKATYTFSSTSGRITDAAPNGTTAIPPGWTGIHWSTTPPAEGGQWIKN